jgi:hypothetical protein
MNVPRPFSQQSQGELEQQEHRSRGHGRLAAPKQAMKNAFFLLSQRIRTGRLIR